jgi:hypothetical protein
VVPAVDAAIGSGGVHVVVVEIDRASSTARHRAMFAAAAAALVH